MSAEPLVARPHPGPASPSDSGNDPRSARNPGSTVPPGATRALVLATLGFALACWAWTLLSPLGPIYVERGLAPEASLLVAIPVLVGSLGRIPVGALTDRFGGRVMFPAITLATVVPVLFIGFIGQYTYPALLVGGFFLGIAGTAFAIGIPYVNSWFPAGKRGLATGLFGASMGGTSLSAFTTVPLLSASGDKAPFVVTAVVLMAYSLLAWRFMPTSPTWSPSRRNIITQTASVLRLRITWQACYLYALSFGGYVAFTVFLPTLLSTWYGLSSAVAAYGMAGFVVAAVLLRPLGGVLSDRIGAGRTLLLSYLAVLLGALVVAAHPPLMPVGSFAFLVVAAGLGLGTGAVFALVAQVTEPSVVGSVTGVVGAAGGLGGFFPPLVMAAVLARTGTYSPAILLLAVATLGALAVTWSIARAGGRSEPEPAPARA
ncbi:MULTISPECIES: nitrate/nitrite transporter [unclassified Brachybacterium]|uniref:MFS transporter n=1 Tax=unclassified Brachybacterium TaxID=2623841 RepID=UPI003616D2A0